MANSPRPLRLGRFLEQTLDDIADHLDRYDAQRGTELLNLFFEELHEAYLDIQNHPTGFAFWHPPFRRRRLRRSGFLVIYEIEEQHTLILTVASERSDEQSLYRSARRLRYLERSDPQDS